MKFVNFSYRWATIAHYLSDRTENDIKNHWNTCLKKMVNGTVPDRFNDEGHGSNNTTTQSCRDTESSKDIWIKRVQSNVYTAKNALLHAVSVSPLACSDDLGDVSPPALLEMNSTLAMSTPHGWNMNFNPQYLPITTDDLHFHNHTPDPIDQVSNYYTNLHPSSIENIEEWLQRWTKESPNGKDEEADINILMKGNSPATNDLGIMNNFGDDIYVPSFTTPEN